MKKKSILFFVVFFMSIAVFKGFCKETEYFRATFLDIKTAEKRWGIQKFDSTKFKTHPNEKRAPMAVFIAKHNLFIGKTLDELRGQLGKPNSFFFSDAIPAYIIDPYSVEKKESWQLVFIPDEKKPNTIKMVKIHKKCCYGDNPFLKKAVTGN